MTTPHLRLSSSVRASISDDGLVLLDVHGGVLLASNAVGARIWQWLEQALTPSEIADRVAAEYGVSAARARHDVEDFVRALAARGLVTDDPAR